MENSRKVIFSHINKQALKTYWQIERGFSRLNLQNMRKLYVLYSICQTDIECLANWCVRELQRQI
jgi:hypothetical protein